MKFAVFLISAFIVTTASAKTTAKDCPPSTEVKYGTTVIRNFYSDIGLCTIGVSPKDGWQMLSYRDYSVSSDSLFMVFNSFSNTGQFTVRNFMLFPRTRNNISYKWNDAKKELIVTGVSNDNYTFDAQTAQIKSITGAKKVKTGPVSKNNFGGVEIQEYRGQLLDVGYAENKDPSQDKNDLSKFIQGSSVCQIKNAAIFNYLSNGDIQFKFSSDKPFFATIKAECQ